MRRAWPKFVVILTAFAGLFAVSPSFAEDAKPIAHGQDMTAAHVGPAAAGYRDLKAFAGSEIKDGKSYPFAREIAGPAAYDGFEIDGSHLLIEAAAFSSSLDVYTSKTVVLRGVSVRPATHSPVALLTRPGAGPVYVLWSDFGGSGTRAVDAGLALRADAATIFRSRISGASDGISVSGSGVRLIENFIETRAASVGDHNDAIQLLGAPMDVEIARNKILNRNPQTSCIMMLGANISVRGNYLSGGGWTIYGGAANNGKGGADASNITVTGNVFGRDFAHKSGHFGPVTYWGKANAWSDNRFQDGTPVVP